MARKGFSLMIPRPRARLGFGLRTRVRLPRRRDDRVRTARDNPARAA